MAIQVEYFRDKEILYNRAFQLIEEQLQSGPSVFGLATGATMEPLYSLLVNSDLDFSNCKSFNLDEYIGLPKTDRNSYYTYMAKNLFTKKSFAQSFLPNGEAINLEKEVEQYEQLLQREAIDFQLLGVGENGHIGFNEPGTLFTSTTHVVDLTESTRTANARYFHTIEDVPKQAITMGIISILRAKKIVVIALDEKKRRAIEQLISGPQTEDIPITALCNHPQVVVLTNLKV